MSVAIGWIHPIDVAAGFAEALVEITAHDMAGPQHVVARLPQFSSANVSHARNEVVKRFLVHEAEPDYLLFLDSDMIPPVTVVSDLLAHADPVTAPVVGALCFTVDAAGILSPTIFQLAEHPDEGVRMFRLDDYEENTLQRVRATGAACLLIHRSVLRAVGQAQIDAGNTAFPWFEELSLGVDGAKTFPVGEDVAFCLRAGMAGFPIHVATGVEVGHQKRLVLDAALHRQQKGPRA